MVIAKDHVNDTIDRSLVCQRLTTATLTHKDATTYITGYFHS